MKTPPGLRYPYKTAFGELSNVAIAWARSALIAQVRLYVVAEALESSNAEVDLTLWRNIGRRC